MSSSRILIFGFGLDVRIWVIVDKKLDFSLLLH